MQRKFRKALKIISNTVIACNHIVYRASICKSYLAAVATTTTEENEQHVAESALINTELRDLFENNKYYQGKLVSHILFTYVIV